MEIALSILIPVWNEEKIILKTCRFLRKLQLPFKYSELIFIAGGSDNTFNICKEIELNNFNKIIILKQEQGDFKSGALIKGLKKAKGSHIILIDADTLVASNFALEIVKSLKKFDVVNCNYYPMIHKGFWYNFYLIDKLIWSKNPSNLSSLFGAATISLKREVIDEIGVENFFTTKSKAGVDHYMGMILKKHDKHIGFVKSTRVITPRPGNIIDFCKDRSRWFTAFFQLHQEKVWIFISHLILSSLFILFPPLISIFIVEKMKNISEKNSSYVKFFFILFFVEYLMSFLRIKVIVKNLIFKTKDIGHFKGIRY